MKKKFKRYGKRTVSVILTLMMILSCMIIGQIATIDANADTTYYIAGDGITNSNGDTNNWTAGDSKFALTYENSSRYTIVVTLAANVTFKMNKGSSDWIAPANQTTGTVIRDGDNLKNNSGFGTYLLCFDPTGNNGSGWVWLEDTSATQNWYVTGTLAGSTVNYTMTSNNDGTYTYSTGLSYTNLANSHFKFKRVQEQGTETTYGSGADGNDWYLNTNTSSSNGPDHWLNLVKSNSKTYYFNGSSDQLVNLIIDESDITSPKFKFTLVDPNYTNININRKLGVNGTATADATNVKSTTTGYTGASIATIPSSTVLDIEAADTIVDNDKTYYFSRWEVTAGSGNIGDSSLTETTFTPSASNSTVTALYFEKVNANIAWDNNGTDVTSAALNPNTNIKAGDSLTLTFTKNGNKSIRSFTFGGQTFTVPWVNGENTQGTYTFTAPDTLTSDNATLTYTTGELNVFYIDASIDNTFSDQGASGKIYVKEGDSGTEYEVGSSAYNSAFPDGFYVTEGSKVTVRMTDENVDQTNHNNCEYIINGFAFSDPYKINSSDTSTTSDAQTATREQALIGSYSFSFYPQSSIQIVGSFKEDQGTVANSELGLHMLYGNNDHFDKAASFLGYLDISKTVTNKYYVFFPDDLREKIGKKNCYFGLISTLYTTLDQLSSSGNQTKLIKYPDSSSCLVELTDAKSNKNNPQGYSESQYAQTNRNESDQYYYGRFTMTNDYVTSLKIELQKINSSSLSNKVHYVVTPTIDPDAVIAEETGIEVLAKNGTIRGDYNKYANLAETEIWKIGSTEKSNMKIGSVSVTKAYDNKAEKAVVAKGSTITIKTTIKDGFRSQYYVKAFNINGETYGLNENDTVNSNGVYTCEYTIDANTTASKIEITPIYYYDESNNSNNKKFIKFYVENFDDDVRTQWGKNKSGTYTSAILACYAWYGSGKDKNAADSSSKPALGGYPGQPMVYVNGRYEMQVPQYANNGTDVIQGITLNNYVWDYVHSNVLGASSDGDRETVNCQTYDYDDFVVLATMEEVPDYIIFRFKYETTNDFYNGTASSSTKGKGNKPSSSSLNRSSYTNGWEYPFTDYYGNDIDIFNNILTSVQIETGSTETSRFHIVSNGYEENYFGHFATRWYVYAPNGTFVGAIPSSALLYYNESAMESANRNTVPGWFMTNAVNNAGNKTASVSSQKAEFWKVYYDLYKGTSNTPSAKGVPVEITYETAIRAQDYNSGGHPRDPALRNDGRWYYSRTAKINANIIIEYKPTNDELTNSTVTQKLAENGNNGYIVDNYAAALNGTPISAADLVSKTNPVGTITGAAPKFTNAGKFNNKVVASNVPSDPNNSFTFSVPSITTSGVLTSDTTKTQTYLFEGWFIKKDDVYSPINATDLAKLTGSTAMLGETTLVARYTPMSTDVLTITHDLYRDATKYEDSPNAYGGSGKTNVTIDIINASGNSVGTIQTTTNSPSSVSINKTVLEQYKNSGYKLKVTLTSEPDGIEGSTNGSSFVTLYRKTQSEDGSVADSTNYPNAQQRIGYVDFSDDESTDQTNYDAYNINNWNSDRDQITDGDDKNTVVYTCPISDLFTTDTTPTLKTNIVRFYSDMGDWSILEQNFRVVNVKFKYYDRDDSAAASGKAEDVDSTPTTVNVTTYFNDVDNDNNIELSDLTAAIAEAYNQKPDNSSTPVQSIKSVLDEYYFWMSQSGATAADGFPAMINHHYDDENNEHSYLNSGLSSENLAYHTNQYGYVKGEPGYAGLNSDIENQEAKWVSYYDIDGRLIDKDEADIDPKQVYEVVVWGFNTPKQYTARFNNAALESDLTQIGSTTSYKANTIAQTGDTYYYNERVGVTYGGKYDDISGYLENVFSQKGYAGRLKASHNSNNNETAQEISSSDTEYKYVFIGWCDESGTVVSGDYAFQNRITSRITLTALYQKVPVNGTVQVSKGFTISQNQTEKFIDEDNEEFVRYAMMINGYGFTDSDENIKRVALLQIVLPATKENGDVLITNEAMQAAFNAVTDKNDTTYNLRSKIAGAAAGTSVTADERISITGTDSAGNAKTYSCVVRAYVYNALVTIVGNTDNADAIEQADKSTVVIFTNKNRTQMTMIFNEDLVEKNAKRSDVVYFAAIGYDGYNYSDGSYSNSTNNTIAASEIVFTDGFVRYTNGQGSSEETDYENK